MFAAPRAPRPRPGPCVGRRRRPFVPGEGTAAVAVPRGTPDKGDECRLAGRNPGWN